MQHNIDGVTRPAYMWDLGADENLSSATYYAIGANGRELATYNEAGTKLYSNVWANELVGREEGHGQEPNDYDYYYYLKDHLGNTRVVIREKEAGASYDKEVVEALDYHPYGLQIGLITPPISTRQTFTGKEIDLEGTENGAPGISQYYFGARYHDPLIARWTTPDPIRQDFDPYQYTAGDPVNRIDVSGLYWTSSLLADPSAEGKLQEDKEAWEGFESEYEAYGKSKEPYFQSDYDALLQKYQAIAAANRIKERKIAEMDATIMKDLGTLNFWQIWALPASYSLDPLAEVYAFAGMPAGGMVQISRGGKSEPIAGEGMVAAVASSNGGTGLAVGALGTAYAVDIATPFVEAVAVGLAIDYATTFIARELAETIYDIVYPASSGNIHDTGLADLPDGEVSRRARDKTLPKAERRRAQKEEKARRIRNEQKRKSQ